MDDPASAPDRKKQRAPVARFGGLAIIASVGVTLALVFRSGALPTHDLSTRSVLAVMIAAGVLAIVGALDDRFSLAPRWQFLGSMIAATIVVGAGIGVRYIANPFGGLLWLDHWNWNIFGVAVPVIGGMLTWLWLVGSMYTTKILDGIDGLVSGIGVIGAIIIYALTLRPEVQQHGVGMLAMMLAGACFGFLLYNWHPASVYLGESGSVFIGFMLGILAVISGGKIATALLILGLPILDLAFVIVYRWRVLHRSPFSGGDRSHLHFRFLDRGWSVQQTVLFLYSVTAVFGVSTLVVRGPWKVVFLLILAIGTLSLAIGFHRRDRHV
jgi:UDP-GlcNAc:undecaprenyl-phosphate GlcNAc-1-phosphate transferase